jgi:pimeloyl-ACP methyl ester carboxylesterase
VRVFLLHGLARTAASMAVLSHRLKRSGHRCTLFGYHVFARSVDEIVESFRERVQRVLAEDRARDPTAVVPYAVVGHSLGGIVARVAAPDLPPGLECMVLLAPPNRPPALAAALAGNPLFRLFTRDAGRRLNDPDFFARIPEPTVPTLVVAGTRGPRASWLPFEGEPNDGILRVSEARLDGAPLVLVHGVHTFLMNRRDVYEEVERFLAEPRPTAVTAGGGRADGRSGAP